jgi:hypothetical protein
MGGFASVVLGEKGLSGGFGMGSRWVLVGSRFGNRAFVLLKIGGFTAQKYIFPPSLF